MTDLICRAVIDNDRKVVYEDKMVKDGKISNDKVAYRTRRKSLFQRIRRQNPIGKAITTDSTLDEIIEDDKRYGTMTPRNGEYFTVKIFDWDNKWITQEQLTKGVMLAWNTIEKVINIDVRLAKVYDVPDFSVYFKRVADDPLLNANTVQYHYYPINDLNNQNRGVCVVNTDLLNTIDGKGIPLHIYDPDHYPEETISTVKTYDFDDIYVHEGPGHGLGLPHSPNTNTKMYFNVSGMADTIFDEDPYETIPRLQAKYPKREFKNSWFLARWIKYYLYKRDKY